MFGPHLIIDGSRCDTRKLADRILVEQILNDYPAAIGMTKIGGPYMFEYQAPDPAYSGVSGLVVIAESHIAIHTFPELDYFTMDIFSCKNFDHEAAIEYIKNAFDVREMDRMLVQRGLSFKGPHHGKNGATDELIAAAEARIAAGIISKEPALPDGMPAARHALSSNRAAVISRHEEPAQAGRMLWPQYGLSPDYGSYGEDADCDTCARPGAKVVSLANQPVISDNGQTLRPGESFQVNPTASVSGLLDKLSTTAGPARALGETLATWERLARVPKTTLALTISTPVIPAGMRELLVYALDRRYVDVVVTTADELFADVYEAIGNTHYISAEGTALQLDEGRERTEEFIANFLATVEPGTALSSADLWRLLGAYLPQHAPRKGLLQSAAAAGVQIYTPDLSTSAFGRLLFSARAEGQALPFDAGNDLTGLAKTFSAMPRLGLVRVGVGVADAFVMQTLAVAAALNRTAPELTGSATIGSDQPLVVDSGHTSLALDPAMALPMIVTGLAQRISGTRQTAIATAEREQDENREPALA